MIYGHDFLNRWVTTSPYPGAPARVRSILITECENGEARKPMLAHVVAGNMGKPCVHMILSSFEGKSAPIVVRRQGITE